MVKSEELRRKSWALLFSLNPLLASGETPCTKKPAQERRFFGLIGVSRQLSTRSTVTTTAAATTWTATAPVVTRRTGISLRDVFAAFPGLVLHDYSP